MECRLALNNDHRPGVVREECRLLTLAVICVSGIWTVLPCHGTDVDLLADTADRLGIVCIDADYRHAPSHYFPAPIEDIIDAVKWVQSQPDKYDLNRIVLSGFSAGGNIVMGAAAVLSEEVAGLTDVAVAGRQQGVAAAASVKDDASFKGEGPTPTDSTTSSTSTAGATSEAEPKKKQDRPKHPIAGLTLFYPPTNLSIPPYLRPPAPCPHADAGVSTSGSSRRFLDGCYLRTQADQQDPRASPLFVDPRRWPDHIWIGCGDADPLYVQAEEFVSLLREAGHPFGGDAEGEGGGVKLHTAHRMAHAWEKLCKKDGLGWPERLAAYEEYVEAVRRSIA
ncbi:hypothetical protein V8E36_009726 [Tilletia maclaganii]